MTSFPEITALSPLKFTPVYQERPWGGTLMSELLHRETPEGVKTGEAWELSDRAGADTPVAEGELAGTPFSELVRHYGRSLIGARAADAGRFPLLIKLIDAGERLSLQVHPDERTCKAFADGSEPKTEMWYVIAARKGARIMAGLSPKATRLQFQEKVNSPEIEQLLQCHRSVPGDAYFITAGVLHAIGGGNLLLEIQQNSDTTYRLSDWGRLDKNGRSRELHLEKGLAATDFFNRNTHRIPGVTGQAGFNRKYTLVNNSQFFRVSELRMVAEWRDDTAPDGSFHLISAINGAVAIEGENPELRCELEIGRSSLIPAAFGRYKIIPLEDGETTVLKTTL
ncbi:MAG: class I mannose-6-phosphate isomerase [Lentisphaeria bacterium]|nr:class I mannose-6-phosphate isomerase [Lentisphaeria bacterium]